MTASALHAAGVHGACCRNTSLSVAASEKPALHFFSSSLSSWKWGPFRQLRFKSDRAASNPVHVGKVSRTGCCRRFEACHALSLQTVTADNVSENGEAAGPSMQSMDFASRWQGRDDLRQFLTVTKHSFQEGFSVIKERGIVQSTKDLLQVTKEQAGKLDVKKVVSQVEQSSIASEVARSWKSSEPWIKWPLTTFFLLYLLVTVCFGAEVSTDLLPAWILGPLITGLLIRASFQMINFIKGCLMRVTPYSHSVANFGVELYQDARSGTLTSKLMVYSNARLESLREQAKTRRSDLKMYITSGQAATDSEAYVRNKSGKFIEWSTIKYEDFTDWVRPYWRAVSRFFQKIF